MKRHIAGIVVSVALLLLTAILPVYGTMSLFGLVDIATPALVALLLWLGILVGASALRRDSWALAAAVPPLLAPTTSTSVVSESQTLLVQFNVGAAYSGRFDEAGETGV